MKKFGLLAISLFICNLIFAQKEYTVGKYILVRKSGLSNEYSNKKSNYISLSLDSEGNGVCKFYFNENEYDSYDDLDYISVKTTTVKDVDEKEREALLELYYATDGPNWVHNDGWGEEIPVEQWRGIYVTESHVGGIQLYNNNLTGTLPQSIGVLSALQYLDVHDNNLTGTLPEGLSTLPILNQLNVNGNNLNGDFPEHPFSELMNKLSSPNFRFYQNNFTIPLPEWVKKHDNFWEYWPDFCLQKSFVESELDWNRYFGDLYISGPKYILTDLDGNIHRHSEDYANNKLTILYSWASWCPYSKALTPKLVSAYNKYKNYGLKIIGIVDLYNDPIEDLNQYINNCGITWPNISELYYWHTPWDYNMVEFNEKNNAVIPMFLFTETPIVFAINNQGELIFESYFKNYNNIVPLIEEMFGPVETGYYTSTDYSKDGEVVKLQTATVGNGIDIVFLGEAFVDKDMDTDGKYEQKMREAMEQFFAVEPYTSLRDRFNVYTVKVVSPNAEFAADAKHAINEEDIKAFDYAKKALGENPSRMMVGVIYNTNYNVHRHYNNMYLADGSFVSYIFGGIGSPINHEMGGHGIAQLLDEYVEAGNETLSLPKEKQSYLDDIWQNFGAGANVDWHSSASDVKWAKFINDPRYADEKLGVFEGSYLYGHDAYRPTENSMMRLGDAPFNAPSREAIYKNVMKYSETNWTYNFEDFVTFDKANSSIRQNRTSYHSRNEGKNNSNRQKPKKYSTIIKGDWKTAYKQKKGW